MRLKPIMPAALFLAIWTPARPAAAQALGKTGASQAAGEANVGRTPVQTSDFVAPLTLGTVGLGLQVSIAPASTPPPLISAPTPAPLTKTAMPVQGTPAALEETNLSASALSLQPAPMFLTAPTPKVHGIVAVSLNTRSDLTPVTHDARARRAKQLIEGIERTWTREELLQEADRLYSDYEDPWINVLGKKMKRISLFAAGLGPVETLAARGVLAPETSRLKRRIEELKPLDHDAKLGDDASRGVDESLRAVVKDLQRYAPALSADRLVYGRSELGSASAQGLSFSPYLREGNWTPHSFWIAPGLGLGRLIHTLIHEGIHQSDVGYARGYGALFLLSGQSGQKIHVPLIEGYTEWRTRRALSSLYHDGISGRSSLGRDFAATGYYDGNSPQDKPYETYVNFVESLIAMPGGKRALDSYVRDGDPTPLYSLLGGERMKLLTELADYPEYLPRGLTMDRAEADRTLAWLNALSHPISADMPRDPRRERAREFLRKYGLIAAYPAALIAGGTLLMLESLLGFVFLAAAAGFGFLLIRNALKAASSVRQKLRQLQRNG